jgi:hypothetical protein
LQLLSNTLHCFHCHCVQAVSLRDNNFTGGITQFATCTLQSLDLSNNWFSGQVPKPLNVGPLGRGPWLRLQSVGLAQNMLTGTLPEFPYGSVSTRWSWF